MDQEKAFKEFGRFCNQTRKPNLFKNIKAKSGTTANGNIYVKLSLVGFSDIEAAENFGKILTSLLCEKGGYNTNWEKWSFKADESTKTINLVPTEFWKKYNVIPNYAGHFIEFPDDLGLHFDDDFNLKYDGEFSEAIHILTNLSLERIM
jgi:hypothetical protein